MKGNCSGGVEEVRKYFWEGKGLRGRTGGSRVLQSMIRGSALGTVDLGEYKGLRGKTKI